MTTYRIKIDLIKFLNLSVDSATEIDLSIAENENFKSSYESAYGLKLHKGISLANTNAIVYAGGTSVTKTGNDVLDISATQNYVITNATFDETQDLDEFMFFVKNNVFILDIDGKTNLVVFKQISENDYLNKSLTYIGMIQGKFNHSIGLKNINIDVVNYSFDYNYVHIPKLERYYYVDSIELITADVTRLHLKEDVLMSWQDLIRQQNGFVSRYQNSTDQTLVDIRLPLEDKLTIQNVTMTNTGTGSLVNCTLDYNNYAGVDYPNILIISMSTEVQTYRGSYISAPSGSGLPNISSHLNQWEFMRFIEMSDLFYLSLAYRSNDAISSFINSVLWLPFNPTTTFGLNTSSSTAVFVKDKYINDAGVYVNTSSSDAPMKAYYPANDKDGACPYLIIKDFTCSIGDAFYDREPYSNYEMFIPFVGWVKVESSKIKGKRILVYYSMDIQSGISTAYIYNYTDQYVIWSGTCQLGMKVDLTATNQAENIKQKQSNDLNMVLGLMSSALAIGVGVATENPVAIAGGVLTAGKTIASNVNANNMIFERATTSFGTSDGALHSNKDIKLKRTYHRPLDIDMTTYWKLQGNPYNQYLDSFNTLLGYAEISDIHFEPNNEKIYQDEIVEIVDLLQKGVIF